MAFAESWKSLGNNAFKDGNFELAVEHYSKAVELEPNEAKYYVNRSLAYASMQRWKDSALDARKALVIDPKYVKAHYRLVKALLELERFKDAKHALSSAFRECGDAVKEFKELEQEIFRLTGLPLRPKSTDFEVIGELGDGNFSKVYKTYLKATHKVYAIKTIERTVVDKMKRRHPNIENEILMEKRVLYKLDHPGIVELYSTFQDFGTLYYQMEFVGGGDLWTSLHEIIYDTTTTDPNTPPSERKGRTGAQLGLHWSQLRFYFAQMIAAVEHMHRSGIVHRDIKPENIMITTDGYLKFVDFGTAKDLLQRDLNGPEFVGTPDYMSPQTVGVKGKSNVGIESDLWALGVTLYQMILGVPAFAAPSPFLSFLRIKRAKLVLPSWLPSSFVSLLHLLLEKDAELRVMRASGGTAHPALIGEGIVKKAEKSVQSGTTAAAAVEEGQVLPPAPPVAGEEASTAMDVDTESAPAPPPAPAVSETSASSKDSLTAAQCRLLSYDALRTHAFFTRWQQEVTQPVRAAYAALYPMMSSPAHALDTEVADPWADVETLRNVYSYRQVPPTPIYEETTERVLYPEEPDREVLSALDTGRLPSLKDLCLRAVASAGLTVAFATANNGGVRPADKPWMQSFSLSTQRLCVRDRARVLHLLHLQQKVHVPSVYRLFFRTLPESRCQRANCDLREYLGFSRALQGHHHTEHHFAILPRPRLGGLHNWSAEAGTNPPEEAYEARLKASITYLNRLRPKYMIVQGDFVHTSSDDHVPAHVSAAERDRVQSVYRDRFKKLMARVSDTIAVLFVPGPREFGLSLSVPTSSYSAHLSVDQLLAYRDQFGADYYGFWYEGCRGLVVNSTLLSCLSPSQVESSYRAHNNGLVTDANRTIAQEAYAQWIWLEEEIEQAKLCSTNLVLFTYHAWTAAPFPDSAEEQSTAADDSAECIPRWIARRILQWARHHKVHVAFSAVAGQSGEGGDSAEAVGSRKRFLRPFTVELNKDGDDADDTEKKDDSEREDGEEDQAKVDGNDDEQDDGYVNEEAQYEGPALLNLQDLPVSVGAVVPPAQLRIVLMQEDAVRVRDYEVPALTLAASDIVVPNNPQEVLADVKEHGWSL